MTTTMNAERKEEDKVMLSLLEVQTLIDTMSKSNSNKLSLTSGEYGTEVDDLKKEWFRHLLVSLEKLDNAITDVRKSDIPELKKELKDEFIKIEKAYRLEFDRLEKSVAKAEEKLSLANEKLETYKTNTISPMNEKVIELKVKMSMIGFISGAVASLVVLIIKEFVIRH